MYTDKIIVAISVGVDGGDDRHRNGDKDLCLSVQKIRKKKVMKRNTKDVA